MLRRLFKTGAVAVATTAMLLGLPQPSAACPVCFGDPSSPMAIGASWGILLLLSVTVAVLGAFASFFLYLVRRSRTALGEHGEPARSAQARGSV